MKLKNQTQQNPVQVVEQAIQNATPYFSEIEMGTRFNAPNTKCFRPTTWSFHGYPLILQSARSRAGKGMVSKLSQERRRFQQLGGAVKRRDEMHQG